MRSSQKCELAPVSGVSLAAMHGQSALSVPTVCGKQPAEKHEAKSVIKQFPEELNRIMLCLYLCLVFLFESHSFIFRQCGFVNFCFMTSLTIFGIPTTTDWNLRTNDVSETGDIRSEMSSNTPSPLQKQRYPHGVELWLFMMYILCSLIHHLYYRYIYIYILCTCIYI